MLLYLKVRPNQRFDSLEKQDDQWVIRLKAVAIDGKANARLPVFLSEVLGIPRSSIRLVKGATTRFKCVEIDADSDFVQRKLEERSKV
jgi:uncharacterized protein